MKQNWSAMRKRSGVTKVVKGADLNSLGFIVIGETFEVPATKKVSSSIIV